MRTHRPVLIVFGALLALVGLGCLAAGLGVTLLQATQQDDNGFITSPAYELSSDGYAVTTEELRLVAGSGDWFPAPGELAFRVTVTPAEGEQVFIGIADRAAVDAYLADVPHDRITTVGRDSDDVRTTREPGTTAPEPPGDQDLWAASVSGSGTQELTLDATPGTWTLVVMHPDASPHVAVDASVGVHTDLLAPVGVGLLIGAGVLLVLATLLLVLGASAPPPSDGDVAPDASAPLGAAPTTTTPASAPTTVPASPVRLVGRLDDGLSRGLWLVKWLLVVPHLVVLAFLWAAFALLTVVAGVAILFTGRYPRGIFDFNVGVLRWTWRVSHYAYGVLGTDRYPPFTLADDPTHPAQLDVAYPEQLSRGLVLVKWWLLALPHYLVVGIFTGGLLSWTVDLGQTDGSQLVIGTGLVGVLVLVAAVVLLVRGQYPRSIHELVVGMHRWSYRVIAYAALMTDVYPPFRLDTGGDEPAPTGPVVDPQTDTGGDRALLDA